jgi:hypothetical protein
MALAIKKYPLKLPWSLLQPIMYCHVLQQSGYHKYTKYCWSNFPLKRGKTVYNSKSLVGGCRLHIATQLRFRLLRGFVRRLLPCTTSCRRCPPHLAARGLLPVYLIRNAMLAFHPALETQASRFNNSSFIIQTFITHNS